MPVRLTMAFIHRIAIICWVEEGVEQTPTRRRQECRVEDGVWQMPMKRRRQKDYNKYYTKTNDMLFCDKFVINA